MLNLARLHESRMFVPSAAACIEDKGFKLPTAENGCHVLDMTVCCVFLPMIQIAIMQITASYSLL